MGLGEQVRPQCPPLRIEAIWSIPQSHEYLLHDFFGSRPFAQQPAREAEDCSGVPSVSLCEGILPIAGYRKREVGIARVEQIRLHFIRTTEPTRFRMTRAHRFRG
jgi:hypothetical protein